MVPLNNVIMTVITRPVEGLMTFLSTMGCVQEIPLKPGETCQPHLSQSDKADTQYKQVKKKEFLRKNRALQLDPY